jgi:hypothetical protein
MNISNLSNTPLSSGMAGKTSLSPLRMRKNNINNNCSLLNVSGRSTQSKRKPLIEQMEENCFNHPEKVAKFYIESHE